MALANIYRVTQDLAGNVVTDVLGTVTISGTSTLAALFSDAAGTVPLPNPVVNNSTYGSYSLFVAAGTYDMQFVKAGFTFETQRNITLRDPASGVNTITGTANQVLVSPVGGIGAVTLSLPQNIAPDSSVQFDRLGLGTPGPVGGVRLAIVGGGMVVDSPTLVVDFFNHRVGIGTVSPNATLAVAGSLFVSQAVQMGDPVTTRTYLGLGSMAVQAHTSVAIAGGTISGLTSLVSEGRIDGHGGLWVNAVGISANAATEPGTGGYNLIGGFVAATNGLGVGTGTGALSFTLACNGSAAKVGGGPWADIASSQRLKHQIRPIVGALAMLLRTRPRWWEWRPEEAELAALLPGRQAGFVIEEIAEDFPEWLLHGSDGTPALSERGATAYLVAALGEIVTRLEALEAGYASRGPGGHPSCWR